MKTEMIRIILGIGKMVRSVENGKVLQKKTKLLI
jgi:hypothetical protein